MPQQPPKSSRGKGDTKSKKGRSDKGKGSEKKDEIEDTGAIDAEQMGNGCFEFINGAVYEGDWKIFEEGKCRHGFGAFANSGETYRGEWKRNVIHGQGTYEFANGNIYRGEFVGGMFDGNGTYRWADTSVYEGQWYKNKMHGLGTYTTKNGDRYHGSFERDQFLNSQGYWIPPAELADHATDSITHDGNAVNVDAPETLKTYRGACACRSVRVHMTPPLLKTYICHCSQCRRLNGGPFTLYALCDESQIKFTGTGQFKSYATSEDIMRYHCKTCGSPLATHLANQRRFRVPVARFLWHGNQIDRTVAPTVHEHYQDRVMDMPDSLIKYKTTVEAGETMGDSELTDKKRMAKTKSADKKKGESLRGACLCGNVQITTSVGPQGDHGHLCHCSACQSYCGSPFVSFGVFPDNAVSFTGAEFLRSYQTTAGAMRYRCRVCFALCRLHLPARRLSHIPLALLGVVPSVPAFHQYYSNRLMDCNDTATKFIREKGSKAVVSRIEESDVPEQ
jgi:hypothetical protein